MSLRVTQPRPHRVTLGLGHAAPKGRARGRPVTAAGSQRAVARWGGGRGHSVRTGAAATGAPPPLPDFLTKDENFCGEDGTVRTPPAAASIAPLLLPGALPRGPPVRARWAAERDRQRAEPCAGETGPLVWLPETLGCMRGHQRRCRQMGCYASWEARLVPPLLGRGPLTPLNKESGRDIARASPPCGPDCGEPRTAGGEHMHPTTPGQPL
jgi:hypothetical protein